MPYILSEINIYPIKSLGGISLLSSEVTDRGLKYDRRWMLVDENNKFMTQRQIPEMALLRVHLMETGLQVQHKTLNIESLYIPFLNEVQILKQAYLKVEIWDDVCDAIEVNEEINQWFSLVLKQNCKLVYMPDNSLREVEKKYAFNNEITSFSDAYPLLIIGQSTLEELNGKLEEKLPMNRFRPNLVYTGGLSFEEDVWKEFKINTVNFICAKPCARCNVTTTNQETAEIGKEPLKTLSTYRKVGNKILFGQNLLNEGTGVITVGEKLLIN